ncbi:MAG: SRPBCC domain-containing protein [Haloferacaceae archaeon]
MRDIEVSRVVAASPPTVRRALTPTGMVVYEGSFSVVDVAEGDADGVTHVTVGAGGLEMTLRFEEREDGLYYTQEGESGPFASMQTRVTVEAESGGSRVTAWSNVSLGLPLPSLTDRVAGWKRRGELRRALEALEDDVT